MQDEEQVFDFMAAAEETGKQLDEMAKRLPGEMKTVLAEEWRKSSWLSELSKAAEQAGEATKQVEAASRFLARTVNIAGLIVCFSSLIIPLAAWGVAHWNLAEKRRERLILEREKDELAAAAEKITQAAKTTAEELVRKQDELKNCPP